MSKFKIIEEPYLLGQIEYILDTNTECTICRSNLNESSIFSTSIESNIKKGICGHVFHIECITPWVKKTKKCPLCFDNWT